MADSLTIAFEPEDYFSGQLDAYGVFVDGLAPSHASSKLSSRGVSTDTGFRWTVFSLMMANARNVAGM